MPRVPAGNLPLRPPFGGLKDSAPSVAAPLQAASCLNIDTRQGDIRRRAGLAKSNQDGNASGYRWLELLRALPFFYKQWGDDATARKPFVALLARSDSSSVPGTDVGVRLFLVPLSVGASGAEAVLGPYTAETIYSQPLYRLGLLWLGTALLVRPRLDAMTLHAKDGHTQSWSQWAFWLTAPTTVTATQSAGSLPSGTYRYLASWVNSRLGLEGPTQTTPTQQTSNGSQKITVSISGGNLAGVDQWRLYRQQDGVDSDYYLIATGTLGTSYDDNGAAVDKTNENRLDVGASYQVQAGCDASWWQGRLWLDEFPNRLFYSEYGRKASFRLSSALQIGEDDDDEILRHVAAQGVLFIPKHRSLWAVTGSGPESFERIELAKGADFGLAGSNALAVNAGTLYYAGHGGLYAASGSGIEKLSAGLDDTWAQWAARPWLTLAYEPQRGLVIVAGYTDDARTAPRCLVCHVESRQWWQWDLGQTGVGLAMPAYLGPSQLLVHRRAAVSWPLGLALLRAENEATQTDCDDAVTWHYEWELGDLGTPWPKHVHMAYLGIVKDTGAAAVNISLTPYPDQAASGTARTIAANLTRARACFPLGFVCDTLRMRVGGAHSSRPRITDVELSAEVVGQR